MNMRNVIISIMTIPTEIKMIIITVTVNIDVIIIDYYAMINNSAYNKNK